jgi:hypothetical protein
MVEYEARRIKGDRWKTPYSSVNMMQVEEAREETEERKVLGVPQGGVNLSS